MYKEVSIAGIIGRFYIARNKASHYSESLVRSIFNEIRKQNEFIAFDSSYKNIKEICGDDCLKDGYIVIPDDDEIRESLKREFYKMDADTRDIVSGIVHNHIRSFKKRMRTDFLDPLFFF